ncbi:endonuclease/exonuclease/phosphatase family protein [Flammeovirga sp. EKP202]|uniref:endonuclease/exonuclease/phosphatase family protein n=1 Tax=Flammeovirga sp. EKP202 TaxID=2770592 RepID=UPI00165FCF6C|nr:endonuclease/exonuclease/phosphatase family protein [Flammeovirga sp. EKP202]MBD0400849.1 endonuclease/exonuclease/phosphatase family protein [Flammeovirga sp. EKP202]
MRIATFNIENLDFSGDDKNPSLELRKPALRNQFERMNADVVCLQEVHGQETPEHSSDNPNRTLSALDAILDGTKYQEYHKVSTMTQDNTPRDKRNLVILSKYEILEVAQYNNEFINNLKYKKVTQVPESDDILNVNWERPIFYVKLKISDHDVMHVINVHFKSRLASNIKGQLAGYQWKSAAGWAEGYFLSSIKRVGQALETRILIDNIFEQEPEAKIVVCGDFNAEPGQVPVEAIQGKMENTNNPDLISKELISCSRSIAESIRYSHLHHGKGNLLDHMLVSKSLFQHFKDAKIFNEQLHDESLPFAFDTKYPESDHAVFLSEFNL